MFHAVSLDDLDPAKVLAFTSAELAVGVKRREGLELELIAVVDPLRRNEADGTLELNEDQFSIYDAGKSNDGAESDSGDYDAVPAGDGRGGAT